MKNIKTICKWVILMVVLNLVQLYATAQVSLNKQFKSAKAFATSETLTVSTGKVERQWAITKNGLKTTSLKNLTNEKQWVNADASFGCDWSYDGLVTDTSLCRLISLVAQQSNDKGFTSDYLEVTAEFEYPATKTFIKYQIWAYPDAPGIRTQVWIKGKATDQMLAKMSDVKTDAVRFKLTKGDKVNIYKAAEKGKPWEASIAKSDKTIEYQLFGLNAEKSYQLGCSWWDFEGENRIQEIRLSTVDGENIVEVRKPEKLPDYKNSRQMSKDILFEIPSKLIRDGSIRILIESVNASSAVVGELWLYEKANEPVPFDLNIGMDTRLSQLKKNASEGYSLVAYNDCGQETNEKDMVSYGNCDNLPINISGLQRNYIGYYNDTQHRNSDDTPLLKEETKSGKIDKVETNNWSSIFMANDKNDGFAIVKESHKCVNQYGVETGNFIVTPGGIKNQGTSLYPDDLSPDIYKWYWASWVILWSGNSDKRDLAIKQFDRLRFPVKSNREIYIMTNLWGSSRKKEASTEKNLLVEIDKAAELGIDIVQVEDGWQANDWNLSQTAYPTGWGNIVRHAGEKKVILGLWVDGNSINNNIFSYDKLKKTYDSAKFSAYKVDYTSLDSHARIDTMIGKIRKLILYSGHKTHINYDVTENSPRIGYFWGREYGNVFLENRKCDVPLNVIYHPYLVLRDLWHLSKYTNLNKFQGTIQNPDRVLKELSDAYLHSHAYSVAIPLMSSPLFFEETQFRSEAAANQIKPILSAYKNVRDEMYKCFVYPIGDEPNNHSWSGFQAYNPDSKAGYLTIFRELNNQESRKSIELHFLANKSLKITNLLTNETFSKTTDELGSVTLEIDKNGDFRFFKYEY